MLRRDGGLMVCSVVYRRTATPLARAKREPGEGWVRTNVCDAASECVCARCVYLAHILSLLPAACLPAAHSAMDGAEQLSTCSTDARPTSFVLVKPALISPHESHFAGGKHAFRCMANTLAACGHEVS